MSTFENVFGAPAEVTASAPGRVNIIGEHTDYHEGFVLPTALPQRTVVQARGRDDRMVRVWSAGVSPGAPESYTLGSEARGRGWLDYVQGVTASLAARGYTIGGADLRVESNVPIGGGVSSSAALEIAVLRALRELASLAIDDVAIARVAQAAEVEFVGAPVGIMDQMACSIAVEREALWLDTRTLSFERIPFPAGAALIVIDSGVPHQHAGGEYATRRRESGDAAAALGVKFLRDLSLTDLPRIAKLPPMLARRARHIVSENDRVTRMVDALRTGTLDTAGLLLDASHASLRDDYQVSTPDVDALVAIGQAHPAVFGARMTGGGFGGAVVMLARHEDAAAAAASIAFDHERVSSRRARILVPSE
jgi:galactokinase